MPVYTPGTQSDLPKSVLNYLAHSHAEGTRNPELFRAAQQCHWANLEQAVTVITLLPRAKQDGLGESEIRETIASAYRQEARDPARNVSGGKGSNTRTAPLPSASSSNGEWPEPAELPVPPPGLGLAVLMTTLFGSEGISIGAGISIIDGKLTIDGGIVKTWEQWQAFPRGLASLNRSFGLFFRVNRMRHGTKNDKGVVVFRHALIECDKDDGGNLIPPGVQLALYQKLGLPIVALIFSGGRSLHAIVRIDAADEKQWRERYAFILSLFPPHAADPQNGHPSRYTRLPGFEREEGKMPQLLAVYPTAQSYETWEKEQASKSRLSPGCVSGAAFLDLVIPPKRIIIDDWLKEGEVGYIYAFRGVGKTWMVIHFCTALAMGQNFGPWKTTAPCPVMYVDGEMSYHDNCERILGLVDHIPEKLSIINHEVLFQANGEIMNFADPAQQRELLRLALDLGIKVIVLDNISCLFSGVKEDKSDEWEKVKPWLLDLRRHRISPVLVHHSGYDLSHMRGTSSREDAASWVMRLDSKKEDFETMGAKFISRFTKYRGKGRALDHEWTFEPDPADPGKINVYYTIASRAEVLLQWVQDGLAECGKIAKEMGISEGWASKLATQWIKAGKLRKKGREYEVV